MTTLRLAFVLATLFPAIASHAQAPAAGAAPALEKLVPKDALLLGSFPSPGTARAGFEKIPVVKIAEEPEVKQFFASYEEHAESLFGSLLEASAKDYYDRVLEIDKLFDRQLAFALLERAGKIDPPRFVALLDSSGPPEKVREFATTLEKGMMRKIFEQEPKREDVAGSTITSLAGSDQDLAYAIRGSTLFLGSDRDAVALVLGAPRGDSLADDATFAASRAKVSAASPLFFGYVNLRRLLELGAKDDAEDWKLNQIAGTAAIHGIAFGLGWDGADLRDRVFFAMPEGAKGFFKSLSVNPVRPEAARNAPQNSLCFASLSLKPSEFYRTITELSREKHSNLDQLIGQPIDRFEKEVGLQVGKDFVDLLGGEIDLFAALPAGGGFLPDVALVADLVDAARFEKSVDELTRKYLKLELREIDFEGWKIRYVATRERGSPITLSFAVASDRIVVSYQPQTVKTVLSRIKKQDAGLAGDADFQAASKRAGEAQALGYLNSARTFAYLHGLIVPLSQMIGGSSLPFDPATIPTVESITKHLRFSVSAVRAEKAGLFIDSISEGVGPAAFAAFGTMVLGVAAPTMIRSESKSRSQACTWKLQSLRWQALGGLSSSGKDYPSAEEVKRVRESGTDKDQWICASDRDSEGKPVGYSSFEYFFETHPGGATGVLTRDLMLLYDREPRHFGGRNVLFADGQVRWLDEPEFQKKVRAQVEGKK